MLIAGGLDAYVAVPKKPYSAAVLVITDIYGYKNDNVRLWADHLAHQVRLTLGMISDHQLTGQAHCLYTT